MAKAKDKILIIAEEAFYTLGALLLLFIILEIIRPKIVLAYVNINLAVIIWAALGLYIIIKNYARSKNN